jgi:hypothetical protein
LQESLNLSDLTAALETLYEKESLHNELEDYERKRYKLHVHASEEDNKKLQEKNKGLEAEAALEQGTM